MIFVPHLNMWMNTGARNTHYNGHPRVTMTMLRIMAVLCQSEGYQLRYLISIPLLDQCDVLRLNVVRHTSGICS